MNLKTLKRIICACLLGGALLISTAVNAAVVTNRLPLLGYANQAIAVYRSPGNMQAGLVAAETALIQIRQVRSDGWAYGSYPIANGRRANGWFKMRDIQANVNYNNCNGTMLSQQTVYRTTSMSASNGVVSAGESVLVIGEQGRLAQIIYKQQNSANWRIGWVLADAVRKTQNTDGVTHKEVPVQARKTTVDVTQKQVPAQTQKAIVTATPKEVPTQTQNTQPTANVRQGSNIKVAEIKSGISKQKLAAGSVNIPEISRDKYIIMYALSPNNDTPVFTNASLNQRGASNPFKAYNNATIFANDEIYVYEMNNVYALVLYPTPSGKKEGYVNTSSLMLNNFSRGKLKSRNENNRFTTYRRPGGPVYGSIDNGDDVWTLARVDNYTQVVYPVDNGRNYKMAWVTNSDYDRFVAEIRPDPNPTSSNYRPNLGDINGDGQIALFDLSKVKFHFLDMEKIDPRYLENADIDGDGVITLRDIAIIKNIVIELDRIDNYNNKPYKKFNSPFPYGAVAKRDVNACGSSDLTSWDNDSKISQGTSITILGEEGNAYLIKYRSANSGERLGWVDKSVLQDPLPEGLLSPLKGGVQVTSESATLPKTTIKCDYVAAEGTPIYAPANGKVEFKQSYAVGYNKLASYGNHIVFKSDDGKYEIKLCHLSAFISGVKMNYTSSLEYPCGVDKYKCSTDTLLVNGSKSLDVKKGWLIGYTGVTGNAKGAHVHIEVKENGSFVAPTSVFTSW